MPLSMAAFFVFLGLVLIGFRAAYGRHVGDFHRRRLGLEFDEIQIQSAALVAGIGLLVLAVLIVVFQAVQ